jgi:hypothetical protein
LFRQERPVTRQRKSTIGFARRRKIQARQRHSRWNCRVCEPNNRDIRQSRGRFGNLKQSAVLHGLPIKDRDDFGVKLSRRVVDKHGGRIPKWLKGVDRKSAIRWFESISGLCLFSAEESQELFLLCGLATRRPVFSGARFCGWPGERSAHKAQKMSAQRLAKSSCRGLRKS